MSDLEDALRPLAHLPKVAQGPAIYFRSLIAVREPHIQAGAWMQLLSQRALQQTDWPQLLVQCSAPAVRNAAVTYFESLFEHDLARRAAATPAGVGGDVAQAGLLARLDFDTEAAVASESAQYLASGNVQILIRAARQAETAGGWKAALPWCVRALALAPTSADFAGALILLLVRASQADLLQTLHGLLTAAKLHPTLAKALEGALASIADDDKSAVAVLSTPEIERLLTDPAQAALSSRLQTMRADSMERLGQYEKSFKDYVALNLRARDKAFDPALHYRGIEARARLEIPALPPDPRHDVIQMLGFPRSGTTLLENVLAAHPDIETFEEIPSHQAAFTYLSRAVGNNPFAPASAVDIFLEARRRYYRELDIRREKPSARILIDKLPVQSGDAFLMKRLYPTRRYIFSIRHPFDVVLSCFRQQFVPNHTMENFRTIADTVRLYDYTMTQWFKVFALDSPEVAYVRYDALVTEFEPVVRGVLDFLGAPWDESVNGFAALAGERRSLTPSYEKVRKGLSIGVQTYWRNYGFVFQSPEARPLYKWAEFFGYPTS